MDRGQSLIIPLLFDGTNYTYWKVRIKAFLQSLKKKETKNPKAKKANSQKPKQKKQYLCNHCGVVGHTRPNCYKWLATQQSNGMIASGNQNQLQSFLAPLGDILKALTFLSNLNG